MSWNKENLPPIFKMHIGNVVRKKNTPTTREQWAFPVCPKLSYFVTSVLVSVFANSLLSSEQLNTENDQYQLEALTTENCMKICKVVWTCSNASIKTSMF